MKNGGLPAQAEVHCGGAQDDCVPPPAWTESERLEVLASYDILDSPREVEFNDVVRLAADVFEAPIAVVNLLTEGRQWFKAEVGIGADELPLEVSICAHAILQPGIFIVRDTTQDIRFASNPLVTGEPGLRFYAGALLETPEGLPLGTVCVLDTKARPAGITDHQRLTLEVLARQVMTQLELRRAVSQRDQRAGRLEAEIQRRRAAEAALRESEARLTFLDSLGAATAPLSDADAVLATTTRLLGEHLSLAICAYADMDEDQDGFTIRGDWAAPGSKSIVGHYSLADFGQLALQKLSAGLPLIINDNLRELPPEEAATFQSIGITATICMPLVKDGRLTALMAIHDRVPRVWTAAEQSLLLEVTARSWAHVERVGAIAELQASEERLRELNETLEVQVARRTEELQLARDIIEANASPICAFDTEYRLIAFNRAHSDEFFRIFNHRVVVGEVFPDLFPPDQAPTMRDFMARALAGESYTVVEEFGDPALVKPYWEVSYTPLRDKSGRVVGAFHLANDITARLRAQAELTQTQEALRQSQKMEAMGQLTGGVAHDFNNLLTPIIGSLDMLVRRELGSERERRLIDGALQSAERAKTLVQRLLAFARRQPLQPKSVDLKNLVSGMADLISSTTGPKIEVRVSLADDLPPATADANQLEMAILNLAVNARDAMPNGGTLAITAVQESVRAGHQSGIRQGHYVRLSIADTGTGMDEATLSRAIEPFFSTKGIGKGTGLGLSMVHGLISQLDGELTISSTLGEGTIVNLLLPVSLVGPKEDGPKLGVQSGPSERGTALLVDDEDLVRMSTADMLMDLGYSVAEATSGEEAMRLVQEGLNPDVLVTDHLMPGMTGVELARDLRARQPELPVLIVSGYAEADGIAPEVARLTKPFRNSELAESLASLVELTPLSRSKNPGSAASALE